MSLIWTLIDVFLFIEIAIVLLLVLPVFSPQKWNQLFKSKFLAMLSQQAQLYFYMLFGLLVLGLLEAIREMRKYSSDGQADEQHLDVEMQQNMRLFRAQRNFYISGFATFLVLVIKRLITLISQQAFFMAQSEASLKQAKSASAAVSSLLKDKPAEDGSEDKQKNEVRFNSCILCFDMKINLHRK